MRASRGEIKIQEILQQSGLRFTMEQSFEGLNSSNGRPLRFDFCVYDDDGNIVYGTGLAFEIPEGYVGLLFPRSSNAKKDLILSNSVGVIDSDYRGEVSFKFKPSYCFNKEDMDVVYDVGDKVGQMIIVPYPHIEWEQATELSETKRGKNGYGSTGKQLWEENRLTHLEN